ncbi:aspartate-alanine antiporter [Sphingomonas sp. RG327]|uniref:Aspartate-alanine antiporter n=1 Tax=Sphingomonas anseongensis TaxID=2908207 RepID=A0ABT0RFZ3_9SPHN|nr:aspartate-alanine antiporter [Sphingomonas anseongensis]MCL6679148.1 aspartate-alanine antiporter [Sphingomonas anseongensis]
MTAWFIDTLKTYPELLIFVALALGFWIGPKKLGGFSLGNVTATLLAAIVVGQLGIPIAGPIKSAFFLLFLFAVGYGVGPQFFAGLSKEGPKQILFTVIVCSLCLASVVAVSKFGGFDIGYAAGIYAGSQTISASIGVATDQINRLGQDPAAVKAILDKIPVGYAVTYIYGTVGSAIVIATLGPKLLRIDLPAACVQYEADLGGAMESDPNIASAYRKFDAHAYRVTEASGLAGKTLRDAFPGVRIFAERVRRGDEIVDANDDTVLQAGDVAVISGPRDFLVEQLDTKLAEVTDRELLDLSVEKVDVLVRNKAYSNKTISELAEAPFAQGIFLRKIVRNLVEIPVYPNIEILRGDILTIVGSTRRTAEAVAALGYADRPTEATDLAVVAAGIVVGGLIGALTLTISGVPISLSPAGGALLLGLILGYLRAVNPIIGNIPAPSLWLMNTLGLNVFIAIVGINAGPGFVQGLIEEGISLFLWGIVATSIPLVAGLYLGRYVFKFHPAILFGVVAGARTTTAALGMVQEEAKSKVPALGYGMPYAVGNTLLTIFGMAVVLLMS